MMQGAPDYCRVAGSVSGGPVGPVGGGGLQALVDAWCRDVGRPLYGPDPHHTCGPGCTVLGTWPHQVCAESRQEHHCGGLTGPRACRFLASTGEGTVCTFSGRVLGGVADTVPSAGDPHWGHVSPPPCPSVPPGPPRCPSVPPAPPHNKPRSPCPGVCAFLPSPDCPLAPAGLASSERAASAAR
jgi:hypothetical protein